ncbi:MAG: NTP transferase domain-containing protein [Planctomycetes bacterium]|nr:NTP transferase domain-containing protein [Planctomycetota bacterium]
MTAELVGVILAAGKGSRLDPFNAHYPKPLLPIGNKPIIEHHLELFRALGIRRAKIVIGHLGDRIVSHFGNGDRFGIEIDYVEQEQTLGIAHAVGRLANEVFGPFLLVLGDIYYAPRHFQTLIENYELQGGGAVLAVMREPDPAQIRRNFSVELDGRGRVRRVIEKPRRPANDLKGCGVYLFGEEIFDAVAKTPRTAMRDEYEITTTIQLLCDDGVPVSVAEVVAWDYNITFARDLLGANLKYLASRDLERLVHPDAQVHPDARLGSVVIGPGVQIKAAAEIDRAVLLPGAQIERNARLSDLIVSAEEWFQC